MAAIQTQVLSAFELLPVALSQAVGKLQSMRESTELQPDAVSYNCVISACQRAAEDTVALQVPAFPAGARQSQPDMQYRALTVTGCEILGCLTSLDLCRVQCACHLQLFEEMVAAKLVPDTALFATLITACERKGDWHRAIQLFNTMKVCCWITCCQRVPSAWQVFVHWAVPGLGRVNVIFVMWQLQITLQASACHALSNVVMPHAGAGCGCAVGFHGGTAGDVRLAAAAGAVSPGAHRRCAGDSGQWPGHPPVAGPPPVMQTSVVNCRRVGAW